MPSVSSEIIADITNHISNCGGDFTTWCVGTARDWGDPVLEAREQEEKNDDFICREAYTPSSARTVRLHFVDDCGSAQAFGDASDDGNLNKSQTSTSDVCVARASRNGLWFSRLVRTAC